MDLVHPSSHMVPWVFHLIFFETVYDIDSAALLDVLGFFFVLGVLVSVVPAPGALIVGDSWGTQAIDKQVK